MAVSLCQYDASFLLPYDRVTIVRILEAMLEGHEALSVDLYIVRDALMASCNEKYMDCDGPTNVLSFPGDASLPATLVFSVDTFCRECLLYGQKPTEHFLRLLSHGVVHILGYDHGDAMDALCAAIQERASQCVDDMEHALL